MEGILANRLPYLYRIWQLRYFWFSLVQNDLHHRYKHSFLGIGWSLLRPLAMTTILCMVFAKLLKVPLEDYAPHLLLGMTVWQFFTESILLGCYSFSNGSGYIRQQQVPLAIFPLRSVLGSAFHSCIALGVALGVTMFFKGPLNPLALLNLIPAIALLLLFGWFLAILSGILYTHFPDTSNLMEISLQILFYLTPIMYIPGKGEFEDRGRFSALVELNPLTSILALVRTPILQGTAPELYNLQASLLLVTLMGALAFLALRRLERNLIFWI